MTTLGWIAVGGGVFVLFVLLLAYCACVAAGRSDEEMGCK